MAMLDEQKLQGRILEILELLRKQSACCEGVAAAVWAHSSVTGGSVFVTIGVNGTAVVYTQPGGTILAPAAYGTLTSV